MDSMGVADTPIFDLLVFTHDSSSVREVAHALWFADWWTRA